MESPSGRECDEMTNRLRVRMASTMRWMYGESLIGVGIVRSGVIADVVQELLDAVLSRNRVVVGERQLGCPLEPQARGNLSAEKGRRALQSAAAGRPRFLVAEDRVHHTGEL